MLLHPAIERGAGEAELRGRERDVVAVLPQRFLDHLLFGTLEVEIVVARGRRPSNQDIDVADAEQYGHTEQLSDVETPEAVVLSDEIKRKVGETIARLPPDLRQAITLRELDGLSYEEIAEVMNWRQS